MISHRPERAIPLMKINFSTFSRNQKVEGDLNRKLIIRRMPDSMIPLPQGLPCFLSDC